MPDRSSALELTVSEEHFPRYDPVHGTPDPMVRRLLTIRTPKGTAPFEQTDYGHPGRFNPWDQRAIDHALQAETPKLLALGERITPLLS